MNKDIDEPDNDVAESSDHEGSALHSMLCPSPNLGSTSPVGGSSGTMRRSYFAFDRSKASPPRSSKGASGRAVSMQDVHKEISKLRSSERKYAWSIGGREMSQRLFELTDESGSPKTDVSLPDLAGEQYFYKDLFRRADTLGVALNRLHMELLEREAGILQLRIAVVETMMEFEATSRVFRSEAARILGEETNERMNSSMPNMSQALERRNSGGDGLHSSWPLPETRSNAILDGKELLSMEIHTIVEELSGDSSAPSSPQKSEDERSRTVQPAHPKECPNVIPSNSGLVRDTEPHDGRLSFPAKLPIEAFAVEPREDSTACEIQGISKYPVTSIPVGGALDTDTRALTSSEPPKTSYVVDKALSNITSRERAEIDSSATGSDAAVL